MDQSQVLFTHYEGVIGPSDTKNFINLPDYQVYRCSLDTLEAD